jgi:hypothetical protein
MADQEAEGLAVEARTSAAPPAPPQPAPACSPQSDEAACRRCEKTYQELLHTEDFRAQIVRSSNRRALRRYAKIATRLGRHIVPISAALYAVGFAICVMHYQRRGVSPQSLGYPQFVGAGLLFAGLAWVSYHWGTHLGTRTWKRGILEFVVSTLAMSGFLFLVDRRGGLAAVVFMALAMLGHWVGTAQGFKSAMKTPSPTEDPPGESGEGLHMGVVRSVSAWICTAILFATLAFPNIPQWLGGGAPRELALYWSSPLDADELAQLGSDSDPRCLYETFSTAETLYLMARRRPPGAATCSPSPTAWGSWISLDFALDSERSFVAIPRSRVRLIRYR